MYLFFDTETSGMPDRQLPLTHESQPRVVQIGLLLTDDSFRERAELALLVEPAGITFDPGSVKVHGIDEDTAARYGLPLRDALGIFSSLAEKADVIVAHNIEFDLKIMAIQYAREGLPDPLEGKDREDTMLLAQPVCQIENRRGDGFKPPTLAEAYHHFTGGQIENAHDALADCRACLQVFRGLRGPKQEKQLGLF